MQDFGFGQLAHMFFLKSYVQNLIRRNGAYVTPKIICGNFKIQILRI